MEKTIQSYTKAKVPDFFMYAKDKEKDQVEKPNDSTMNRIAKAIPSSKLNFTKTVSKFDYRMLMNLDVDFTTNPNSPVIHSYDSWNLRGKEFASETQNIKGKDLYVFKRIREHIIEESGKDIDYIVNTLVAILYTTRQTSAKKRLWECFGDVILENLKKNLEGKGKICPICGKRFTGNSNHQNTCSQECGLKMKRIKDREYNANRNNA